MSSENNNKTFEWSSNISKISFLLFTVLLLAAAVFLLRNVLHSIILGAFFAVMLNPVKRFIQKLLMRMVIIIRKRRKKLLLSEDFRLLESRMRWVSSLLTVVLVFCFITVPMIFFVINIAKQGSRTIPSAEKWVREELPQKIEELGTKYSENRYVKKIMPLLSELEQIDDMEPPVPYEENEVQMDNAEAVGKKVDIKEVTDKFSEKFSEILRSVLRKLWECMIKILSRSWITVFNFFIMLFVMFHFFHDGNTIWRYIKSISPLGNEEQKRVAIRLKEISRAIFFGIFGTAFIQGALAMLFFSIVGIPALFWGFMLGICSIIPIVGTGIIWVPATVYLYMTGHVWEAVFILISCGCVNSNIDSIMRPFLMKRGGKTGMSYLVLFFSVLGGLQTFGLVGVIYGPLIMGICGICLLIFSTQFKARTLYEINSGLQEEEK